MLVFQLVFCVASKGTYFNMLPLMRLEYELKSCAIFVELFSSVPLMPGSYTYFLPCLLFKHPLRLHSNENRIEEALFARNYFHKILKK